MGLPGVLDRYDIGLIDTDGWRKAGWEGDLTVGVPNKSFDCSPLR
jgi:hypothetical protein